MRSSSRRSAAVLLGVILGAASLPSCAALESWTGFSGGSADAGRDVSTPDEGAPAEAAVEAGPGPGPIILGQSAWACADSDTQAQCTVKTDNTASLAVTLPGAVQGGDLLFVAIGWYDAKSTVATVVDTGGDVFVKALDEELIDDTANDNSVASILYYAPNANASATETVTVTWTGGTGGLAENPDVRVGEIAGLDPDDPLDQHASSHGMSASAATASISTSSAREVVLASGIVGGTAGVDSASNGFQLFIRSYEDNVVASLPVAATGSYETTLTMSKPANWITQIVSFR